MNLGTVPLKHVSAGPAGIWGADPSNKVYKYVAGDFVPSEGKGGHAAPAAPGSMTERLSVLRSVYAAGGCRGDGGGCGGLSR